MTCRSARTCAPASATKGSKPELAAGWSRECDRCAPAAAAAGRDSTVSKTQSCLTPALLSGALTRKPGASHGGAGPLSSHLVSLLQGPTADALTTIRIPPSFFFIRSSAMCWGPPSPPQPCSFFACPGSPQPPSSGPDEGKPSPPSDGIGLLPGFAGLAACSARCGSCPGSR